MIDDTLALLDEMNEAGRIEYDEAEGIAFWVSTSYEEAAIRDFPELFAERADAESVPATGEGADRG